MTNGKVLVFDLVAATQDWLSKRAENVHGETLLSYETRIQQDRNTENKRQEDRRLAIRKFLADQRALNHFIRTRLHESIEDENPGNGLKPRDLVDRWVAGEHEAAKSELNTAVEQASKTLTTRMVDMSIGIFKKQKTFAT